MVSVSVIVGLKSVEGKVEPEATVISVGDRATVYGEFDKNLNRTEFNQIAIYEFPHFVRDTFPAPAISEELPQSQEVGPESDSPADPTAEMKKSLLSGIFGSKKK
jgi:hypothetical protein